MNDIKVSTEYITLGQFLKLANCASTGGHAKVMLAEAMVKVNSEDEARRGRKLYAGDVVSVEGCGTFRIVPAQGE
ncbi:S4 domain-containing protein YaaA [Paenibacillus profundus]|uniref:S4 domain-containing protein YaaA n=1 Tax=Paenibacillus profundus TaxID=1173085 RepID=A0ABS8YPV4_9BACL|nr:MULTISPECIES: S4 domain-containing protein YaaA [Paenibacillus]MCE5172493.1 S4 domain-containing protein YaaA [Paenibacillus profundus]MCM3341014.1 S4 domain-containing protein YaaA [Paenibacillus sp. MER TA 81-3]